MSRDVLLVGGGHAHVEVVRRWARAPVAGHALVVCDPNPRPIYSGMVPGFVAGQYTRSELEIDLAALCRKANALYVPEAVVSVDAARRRVALERSAQRSYAIASLDIGSSVAGRHLPGVREHALASRPIPTLVSEIEDRLERARTSADRPLRIRVVGAGAGGVEIAFCLDARLRRQPGPGFEITLVTDDAHILGEAPRSLRSRVERAARRRGIGTVAGARVAAVHPDSLELSDGRHLAATAVLWVTGPASHPLASDSGLPVDADGFVRIRPTLEVEGHPTLFAAGDCASLAGMRKAGVYAVRAGPLIDANIRARLAGDPLRPYRPQSDFLSLLNLGDGTAIAAKWGRVVEGRAMLWLKDRIDRAFLERYR